MMRTPKLVSVPIGRRLLSVPLLAQPGSSKGLVAADKAIMPQAQSSGGGPRADFERLTTSSKIADLLNHPAFAGFARLLLPWDERPYDESMALGDIAPLRPYHTHIDAQNLVASLNRMIDDIHGGKTVFYDFYSEEEKRNDSTKGNAGLFFFRGKPGAPFAVISPGGGFAYVGSVHEGFPYASVISDCGYNAFVLKYRAGKGGRVATEDLAAEISYICSNAAALGVSTMGYSLWGSSAGARMAASVGSHGVAAFGGDEIPGPAAVIMAYTGHSDRSANEPPTFVVVGEDDDIAPSLRMKSRVAALRQAGTAVEYREYENLGHGFGPGIGTSAEGWLADATEFWARRLRERSEMGVVVGLL